MNSHMAGSHNAAIYNVEPKGIHLGREDADAGVRCRGTAQI